MQGFLSIPLNLDFISLHRGYVMYLLIRMDMTCSVTLFLAMTVKLVASMIIEGMVTQKQNPRRMQGLLSLHELSISFHCIEATCCLPKLPPRLITACWFRCCASCLAHYFEFSAAFFKPAKPLSNTPVIKLTAVSSSWPAGIGGFNL